MHFSVIAYNVADNILIIKVVLYIVENISTAQQGHSIDARRMHERSCKLVYKLILNSGRIIEIYCMCLTKTAATAAPARP